MNTTPYRLVLLALHALIFACAVTLPAAAQSEPADASPLLADTAYEPPAQPIDQEHVRLALRFEPEEGRVYGVETLRVRPLVDSLRSLLLFASELDIFSVQVGVLDSTRIATPFHQGEADSLTIDLTPLQQRGVPFEVQITYTARPRLGLYFFETPDGGHQIWTSGGPLENRHWFPHFDAPSDRLTSEILATVPPPLQVVSNGRLLSAMETEDALMLYHYYQDQPLAPQHIGLAAGAFGTIEEEIRIYNGQRLPIVHRVPAARAEKVERTFASTASALAYFSERLRLAYPWPRYTDVAIAGYVPEATPLTGFGLFSDRTLLDARAALDESAVADVSRVIASQWFGQLVSPAFWSDAWLGEALAAYLSLRYQHDEVDPLAFDLALQDHRRAYLEEPSRTTRPLVWDQWTHPAQWFDAHTTSKGVWVAHMLFTTLGESAFWEVLENYLKRHAFRAAGTEDFKNQLEAGTARDFGRFFDQWVYAAGHPVLEGSYTYDTAAGNLTLTLSQVQAGDRVPEIFDLELDVEVYTLSGPSRFKVTFEEAVETFSLPLSMQPRFLILDPDRRYLIEHRLTQSSAAWVAQLRYATDPVHRILAARALAEFADDPALLIGLQSALSDRPPAPIRLALIELLDRIPPSDAARRALVSAFEDDDPRVRAAVLSALADYEQTSDLTVLALKSAQEARSYILQAEAVRTLARINAPGALDIVRSALITPSHRDVVRRAALESVSGLNLSTRAGLDLVLPYTGSQHAREVRGATIPYLSSLAALDNRQAMEALTRLLADPDPYVRDAALDGLLATNREAVLSLFENRLEAEPQPVLQARLQDAISRLRNRSDAP